MNEDGLRRYIAIGGVNLHINKNAETWGEFNMGLSRALSKYRENYDPEAPIEIIIVYIVPGYDSPVAFEGTRITIKSRKGPKVVQVEAAVPDILFPTKHPEQAKDILLELAVQCIEEVEVYANRNKIISGQLTGAQAVILKAQKEWDVGSFRYAIPEGLPYYDMPKTKEESNTTRMFVQKSPDGTIRHYHMLLDDNGSEIV